MNEDLDFTLDVFRIFFFDLQDWFIFDLYWSLLFAPLVDTLTTIRHNVFGLHEIFWWWRPDIHTFYLSGLVFYFMNLRLFKACYSEDEWEQESELPSIASISRDNLQSLCQLAFHTDAVAVVVMFRHPQDGKILLMTWKIMAQQSNIC